MWKRRRACSLLLLWILCVWRSWAEDDRRCLLKLKSYIEDPVYSLASWNEDAIAAAPDRSLYCAWHGVHCNSQSQVQALNLSNRRLSGPFRLLPLRFCSSLQTLNLSGNSFTGPLPSNFCQQLPILLTLDLSNNLLDGSIPPDIGNCSVLQALYLQHNRLSGDIPWQLGNLLPHLSYVNLSSNDLSGNIPSTMTALPIPFDVANNPRLSRPPIPSECSPSCDLHRNLMVYLLLIGASCLLPVLACITLALAFHWRDMLQEDLHTALQWIKRRNSHARTSVHMFDTHLNVTQEELEHATSCFSPANIIGFGASSTVYKGRLLDGQEIAVKILHDEELGSSTTKQLFLTELHLLGKLRHRNLVKILGFFCNAEIMGIILDYMPAGSLDALLRHKRANSNPAFGWAARLNILLGIAEGLAYLHNQYDCNLSVIHADLKPANVLIDENMEAHIADFGIATFVSTVNNSGVIASKGQVLPMPCWSLGYTAPEYVQQGLVSRKGDVFSFGVIVLEMITGERPSSDKLEEGESLVEWVSKSLAKGDIEHVIAPMFLSVEEMIGWRKDLSATLRMGCSCASMAHANRPDISEVVTFLRRICKKLDENTPFQALDLYNCESITIVS